MAEKKQPLSQRKIKEMSCCLGVERMGKTITKDNVTQKGTGNTIKRGKQKITGRHSRDVQKLYNNRKAWKTNNENKRDIKGGGITGRKKNSPYLRER